MGWPPSLFFALPISRGKKNRTAAAGLPPSGDCESRSRRRAFLHFLCVWCGNQDALVLKISTEALLQPGKVPRRAASRQISNDFPDPA
jgi:hypothetical protein